MVPPCPESKPPPANPPLRRGGGGRRYLESRFHALARLPRTRPPHERRASAAQLPRRTLARADQFPQTRAHDQPSGWPHQRRQHRRPRLRSERAFCRRGVRPPAHGKRRGWNSSSAPSTCSPTWSAPSWSSSSPVPAPLSPDSKPIIGPVPGWKGVLLATGHTTKGIHLGPITGRIIADYIARGSTQAVSDMAEFLPGPLRRLRRRRLPGRRPNRRRIAPTETGHFRSHSPPLVVRNVRLWREGVEPRNRPSTGSGRTRQPKSIYVGYALLLRGVVLQPPLGDVDAAR